MFKLSCALCTLICCGAVYAIPAAETDPQPLPWFTGPLLTPASHVIPYGHVNIEPYEYVTTNFGAYNPHWNTHSTPNLYNLITQTIFQIGLPANFDIAFAPQWTWNHMEGASHWVFNDMPLGFDYQLFSRPPESWIPTIKLAVHINLPWGKYQKLNPHARGTDIGGSGSWAPSAGLVMSHLVHITGPMFFAPRFNIQYTVPTPVPVKGYNAYGGGYHTRGTVFPGQNLTCLFGCELSLTQNWTLATDIQYQHVNKTRFKGHRGNTANVPNVIGGPSSELFALAPAIEYNWSANYGVIAGAWFSVGGRNTEEFASGVIAINIYH